MRAKTDTHEPTRPPDEAPAGPGLSRRQLVQTGVATLAAAVAAPAAVATPRAPARRLSRNLLYRPNLLVLVTDQERHPQHWPDGWAEANLPNRGRLAEHGLTFDRAFCAASMCSPSRASLFTGLYPAQHGVTEVLNLTPPCECAGVLPHYDQPTLQPTTQNMARMLAAAGYDVQYRGKWHMSKDRSGTLPPLSPADLARYGFGGWLPPDAAEHTPPYFGGGTADNDTIYAAQAADFLGRADPHSRQPFALFVCLVNPHDIMAYPGWTTEASHSDVAPFKGSENYASAEPGCFEQGIGLPPTWDEDTDRAHKPAAQAQSKALWRTALGPIGATPPTADDALRYVNFYAFLHKESDRHFGTVLDALEANPGLADSTLVLHLSDHGEMGLSHGGMRQKAYNAYEETIRVPLVIANPRLFPRPVRTDALASLVDVMPTLATLADVPDRESYAFPGRDLTPVLRDALEHPDTPTGSVQDAVLFTTDETIGSVGVAGNPPLVRQPCHLRCLREARWKLVMTFDPAHVEPSVYELYDLVEDPHELVNRAHPSSPGYSPAQLERMRTRLAQRMAETGTTPA